MGLPVQCRLDTVEPFAMSIITDGMIDMAKFQPVARLGNMDDTTVDNVFTMLRPGMDGSSYKSNGISAPPMPAYRSKAAAEPKFAVRLQMTRSGN